LPQIAVYNKIDRTGEPAHVDIDADGRVDRIWLSAHGGQGIDLLLEALHAQLGIDLHHCILRLPARAGRARARLYEAGAVVTQRQLEDGGTELEVSLRRRDLERICREAGLELPPMVPCAAQGRFLQSPVREAASAAG
jgi:GTP-binding protein HflX